MNQSVRLKLVQGETRSVRMEEAVDKDAVCHWSYSTCVTDILPRKHLKVWILQNKRTSISHCEVRRWACATG